jgi:neutral trehalase
MNKNYLYEWYVDPDTEVCRCGESGMDNTPRFDVVQLMDSIDFSCYMANEMRNMEKLAKILGRDADAEEYANLFAKIAQRINEDLYDEEDGRYYDRELESGKFRKVTTPCSFLPLFAGVCPADRAKRLAEDICDPKTFATPMPLPSVALNDPYHSKDYWRGTVWINYNYMVQQGLRDYGYIEEANRLADATMAGIAHWYMREGCTFETYDPQNILCPSELGRKGHAIKPFEFAARLMSVRDFGWSACLYTAMALEREGRN